MKKLIACLLALIMVLAMAACGGEEEIRGTKTENDSKPQATIPDDTTPEDTTPEDTTPEDTTPEDTTPEDTTPEDTTPVEEEEEITLGVNDGIKYESEFIGIGCTLPEGWSFYTEEQIKEVNNFTEELTGKDYDEAVKNAAALTDMFATSADSQSNCNVSLEKVNSLTLAITDVKDVYEAQKETLVTTYEGMGGTNVQIENVTITIDGKAFDAMTLSVDIYGVTLHQIVFCVKCSGYLATVAISATSADAAQTVLDCFYLV